MLSSLGRPMCDMERERKERKKEKKAFGLLPLLSTLCCFRLSRDGEHFKT